MKLFLPEKCDRCNDQEATEVFDPLDGDRSLIVCSDCHELLKIEWPAIRERAKQAQRQIELLGLLQCSHGLSCPCAWCKKWRFDLGVIV